MEADILRALGSTVLRRLGREYLLIRPGDPAAPEHAVAAKFVRWNLPLHHSWPCCPRDIDGFIEKAAQALWGKFGALHPQTIQVGPLDPDDSNRYYRTLASNLRGRTLQLFPPGLAAIRNAEDQDSRAPTLFCLVGKEGLFCGLQSPLASNGFHPGGTRFIRQNSPNTISRAGAKIAEALHQLQLHRTVPPAGTHWLELGASPGGMTAELLERGYQVTAVDRAPLDKRLDQAKGLRFVQADAATFDPGADRMYDALLSDMNGDARESIAQVIRLARHLQTGGLVVFTLKLPGTATFSAVNEVEVGVLECARTAGLQFLGRTHLTYNRREFTLFFEQQTGTSTDPKICKKPDGFTYGEA
jgi:SAM-dependent methyltransferase